MQAITTIGLDIAKSVFQVHGIDAREISASAQAALRTGILPEAAAVPGPYRRFLAHALAGIRDEVIDHLEGKDRDARAESRRASYRTAATAREGRRRW